MSVLLVLLLAAPPVEFHLPVDPDEAEVRPEVLEIPNPAYEQDGAGAMVGIRFDTDGRWSLGLKLIWNEKNTGAEVKGE